MPLIAQAYHASVNIYSITAIASISLPFGFARTASLNFKNILPYVNIIFKFFLSNLLSCMYHSASLRYLLAFN